MPWQCYKSLAFFRFLHARAGYIKETLALADYHGFLLSHRAINLHSKHVAIFAQQMKDIASHTATLCTALTQAIESLKHVYAMAVLMLTLSALEASVTSITSTNSHIFATVVDAILGSNYFLVRDLLKVLDIGDSEVRTASFVWF